MSFWVPARRYDAELMDRDDNEREVLDRALADIRSVNRWLGGEATLVDALEPFLGERLEILDVGTGAADLPLAIVRRLRALGEECSITAIDRDPTTVDLAREFVAEEPAITVECVDAFQLPYEDDSFDVVTASMFLHHFDERDATRLIAEFRRVARRAVLINDLRRHRLPWAFITAVGWITRRQRMFRHDAPLSVLRGFTADELRRLAPGAAVARRWPFRLAATIPA